MMSDLHELLAEQIGNGPVDLRVGQWIFDRFPGLREVQECSLAEDVRHGFESVHPPIREFIPPDGGGERRPGPPRHPPFPPPGVAESLRRTQSCEDRRAVLASCLR